MYQLGKSQADSSDLGGGMLSGKAVKRAIKAWCVQVSRVHIHTEMYQQWQATGSCLVPGTKRGRA